MDSDVEQPRMRFNPRKAGPLLALAVLASGCVTAIRPYAIRHSVAPGPSSLSALTISVAGQNERDVEIAVLALRRAGVFRTVVEGEDEHSDLSVSVTRALDSIRCGTPQMTTAWTLGLVPTGNVHHAAVALEFSGRGAEHPVVIERDIFAPTKHGLWALFLRARKEWTRPDWGHDPAGLGIALREDLLANEEGLLRLARRHAS